ncbi:hypothetical protein DBR32_09245 [Taibaiella sp. KBW10]|uniref:DUF5074 domain-containing protein n=1 Tax=Taibaiella sp. KBW10 TaxID=2153357 RepID=UPI000F59297A|nr:DUF5074 domain-containing protein [Taibaiella sp. KBW10]RQO30889.1 hypothetical protein DBR32_09245 [Taibaiella sp. KBW10]
MNYSKGFWLVILLCSTVFFSCVKDKPNPGDKGQITTERKIVIANEGVFGNGNASLSYIDVSKHSIVNNVYSNQNNGSLLGDVFQSMTVVGDKLYLIINNSNKIVVVDKNTFTKQTEISIPQPRYMQVAGNNRAYVTNMYGNKIYIVDLAANTVSGAISTTNKNNEGIIALNNKIYVCPWDTACNFIYEIDPASNSITNRIPIGGYAPTQVLTDKNNMLWVVAGNPLYHKPATITQINPANNSILKTISFGADAELIKPAFNPTKDTLYFIGVDYQGRVNSYNGIYRMPITATQAPTQAFIAAQNLQYFWGLGIDPLSGKIYIGDPKGFTQKGSVLVYNPDGSLVDQYLAELGPGYFYFE